MKFKLLTGSVALAVFILTAYYISKGSVLPFDAIICQAVYSIRNEAFTCILTFITYIGNWQTVTCLCIFSLLIKELRLPFGVPLSIAAVTSSTLYSLIKSFFQRPRPDLSLHLISQGGYSFPSGHSMTGLVFYGMLIWLCLQYYKESGSKGTLLKNKKVLIFVKLTLCILIFLIGFSRIYLGVHYPTDILGGWSLGFVVLLILTSILSLGKSKRDSHDCLNQF